MPGILKIDAKRNGSLTSSFRADGGETGLVDVREEAGEGVAVAEVVEEGWTGHRTGKGGARRPYRSSRSLPEGFPLLTAFCTHR